MTRIDPWEHIDDFERGADGRIVSGIATLAGVAYRVRPAGSPGDIVRGALRKWQEAKLSRQGEWEHVGGELYFEPYGPPIDHPLFFRRARIRYRYRLRWKWVVEPVTPR